MASEESSLRPSIQHPYGAVEDTAKRAAPDVPGNSVLLTAGIIIADVVGAGILSMPVAVAKFGWLLGGVVTFLLLAMNVHTSILMWRVRMKCPKAETYLQLADAAFAGAPEVQRKLAYKSIIVTQYCFIFSLLGLYSLTSGRAIGMLFYNVHWCLPLWTFIACAVIFPFQVTARRLGEYSMLIWINVATIVGSACIPLAIVASSMDIQETRPEDSRFHPVASLTMSQVLTGVNVMCFAYSSQFMVVEIISEMRVPEEFPKAYCWISAPFQFIAFMFVGIVGYYYFGDQAHGIVVDMVPFGIGFRFVSSCLLAHMGITFLLKGIVLCNAVHNALLRKGNNFLTADSTWFSVVLAVMAASWLLAQIVPFFTDFVDLLGASFTSVGCYMIPIILYVRWAKDFGTQEDRIGVAEKVVLLMEFALSLIMAVFGTWTAVEHIIMKWHSYGFPFDCHCENMWNTCDCSRDNPAIGNCPG